jgi:hypothetical protein
MQRGDGKDGGGLCLFRFLHLCGQFGQEHLGLLTPRIQTGVLGEPLLQSPDWFEPVARELGLAAERPEASFQRLDLHRRIERGQLERVGEGSASLATISRTLGASLVSDSR